MKKSLLALLSLVLLLAGSCTKKDEVAITPLPLSCSFGNGAFEWNKDTRVSFEGNEDDWAIVKTAFTETNLPVSYEADNTKTNSIRLELVDVIEGISSPEVILYMLAKMEFL